MTSSPGRYKAAWHPESPATDIRKNPESHTRSASPNVEPIDGARGNDAGIAWACALAVALAAGSVSAETSDLDKDRCRGACEDVCARAQHLVARRQDELAHGSRRPVRLHDLLPRRRKGYGAWQAGNTDRYWGVGFADAHGCQNCCYACREGRTTQYNLNP